MEFPADLKYTKEHEWVRVEGKDATFGITEFAQSELGEIVFVELPETGNAAVQGESICVVESTKAASDVYAPISGKVKEVNDALENSPQLVNESPYAEGWLVTLTDFDQDELNNLLSPAEYQAYVADQG